MFGRTPYEAVQNLRSALQRAISCVTPSVIAVRGTDYRAGSEHALVLGEPEAVKISGADVALVVKLMARVQEHAGHEGQWRATTKAYSHTLREAEGPEIIAYHWHPGGRSPIDFPHLHLGAGAGSMRDELQKAHVPTGRVELEDVLALAIREFGVRPRRDDWAEILGA